MDVTSRPESDVGVPVKAAPADPGGARLLRLTAEEAEETLAAIRLGQVDAFLLATEQGDRVYTLQGSEHPYLIFVGSMNEGAVTTTLDGTILFANTRFADLAGVPLERLVGTPLSHYVCPGGRNRLEALLKGERAERPRCEVELCPAEGAPVPVILSFSAYASSDATGFCIVVTDLSEQKRTAALVESEQLTTSILERAGDAIVVLGTDGRVVLANEAAHRLARGNPLLRPYSEVFPLVRAGEAVAADATCGGVPLAGDDGPTEYILRVPSQPARTLLVNTASVPDTCGDPAGCVLCMTDISAQKETERRLSRALDEAASSNRELQHFAYVASHDLQEPLRMVTSYLQLLERRYAHQLDDEAREFIEFAVDGASRMHQQIMDLLAYSRVTSRSKPPTPVDASTAVAEAIARLELKVAETGAEIRVGPLPVVQADPSQLTQVFQNLIGNALTFRSDEPPQVEVTAAEEDGMFRFRVADNGIGIAPEYHDRIFQMFQRLHTRDRYPGSGIGLAIVQRIVERHGGRVWVESAEGQGSAFSFTLPVNPTEEAAA